MPRTTRLAGLAFGLAVAAAPTSARADDGLAIGAYALTGVGGIVTFIGTGATLAAHGTKPNGPALLGWGIASTVSALIQGGFAIAFLTIAVQESNQPCSFFCVDIAALPGLFSAGVAAANIAVAIPALYLSGKSKGPSVTLSPITSFATRGSSLHGVVASGTF